MSVRRRGSALVFVLIIIAGIVTVTIGTQRLSLVQFNQATREEDNTYALYAAKAGIEDGLLRFRHERDVETATDQVHRFNITDGISYGEVDKNRPVASETDYSAADQYYDLAVSFKADVVGNFGFTGQPPTMKQDEEIELTGFPRDGSNYYLSYAFRWVSGDTCRAKDGGKGAFVQIQQVTTPTAGDSLLTQQVVKIPGSNNLGNSAVYRSYGSNSANLLLNSLTSGLASVIRVRAYHCPVEFAFSTARDNNDATGGPDFDSLETKITATGFFGKAKRTLEATVDRKSGRLISIYDFNLYSGETCIGADPSFLNSAKCE